VVPTFENERWVRSPIDAFVLANLKQHGLAPAHSGESPYPDPASNLRPHRTAAYAARSGDPQAYEKLVDRLLDSPRYGEKWGSTGSTWSASQKPTALSTTLTGTTRGPWRLDKSSAIDRFLLGSGDYPCTGNVHPLPPRSAPVFLLWLSLGIDLAPVHAHERWSYCAPG
jgi:hypothetical protein